MHILLEGGNHCLCKCHNIKVQTEDATSSENMDHFDPGLVRPGRCGLIVGMGRFSLTVELLRPWVVSALGRFSQIQ